MKKVITSISFDDPRSQNIRFLEEAAREGELHVLLWSDEEVSARTGAPPKFPVAERKYYLENLRYVTKVSVSERPGEADAPPEVAGLKFDVWVVDEASDTPQKAEACKRQGMGYVVISTALQNEFPVADLTPHPPVPGSKKVIVTGCYDWFHTGHVRFFEEVSELGSVYAVVGHDANIAVLKGEHHPMFKQDERRYIVGSLKTVHQAFIATADGYLDAAPEIERIKPDIYAVNDDGDRGGKGDFCKEKGIEYAVLRRTPKEGLTKRSSTDLRGF